MYTGTNVSITDPLRHKAACFLCGVGETESQEDHIGENQKVGGRNTEGFVREAGENATTPFLPSPPPPHPGHVLGSWEISVLKPLGWGPTLVCGLIHSYS